MSNLRAASLCWAAGAVALSYGVLLVAFLDFTPPTRETFVLFVACMAMAAGLAGCAHHWEARRP